MRKEEYIQRLKDRLEEIDKSNQELMEKHQIIFQKLMRRNASVLKQLKMVDTLIKKLKKEVDDI